MANSTALTSLKRFSLRTKPRDDGIRADKRCAEQVEGERQCERSEKGRGGVREEDGERVCVRSGKRKIRSAGGGVGRAGV